MIWGIGVIAALSVTHLQPFGLGRTGDALVAPVLSNDARWFTGVALHGYQAIPHSAAYLPLYPLLLSAANAGGLVAVTVLGVAISVASFTAALWLLFKLVRLDFGEQVARRTVVLVAVFPTAVFFTAAYAESLFLLLTVAALYAARRERWGLAALLGALASATRVTGIALIVALPCLYLLGPRGTERFVRSERWRVRFPLRRDVLWLVLVPAGYVAFGIYTLITFGDLLANAHAAPFWGVTFHGPLFALVDGTRWGLHAVSGALFSHGTESLSVRASHVAGFAFLPFALVAVVGAFRREPVAYAMYALLSLVPELTSYVSAHPLTSLQRYMSVLFPLHLWLALWASNKARFRLCVGVFAAGLIVCAALFATDHLA